MTLAEHNQSLRDIIDELNELCAEKENAGEYIIDCVVDQRADDGLPPFTPEELAAAEAECGRVLSVVKAIVEKIDALREKYYELDGKYPYFYEAIDRYGIRWR